MNKYLAFLALALLSVPAHAGVGKLSSAEVTDGKLDAQYNVRRYGDDRKSKNNAQQHKFELEYGLTDDWMIGIELEANRQSPSRTEFTAYGGELKYQMTSQSDGWWFNSAAKAEYGIAAQSTGNDAGEAGILLSRKDGNFKTTANFKFEQELGDDRDGGVDVATALQTIYHIDPLISPGLEWHADYGKANNFESPDQQEHYLGVIGVGTLFEVENTQLLYEIGYFRGLTDVSADDAQRFRIKYEIFF